jgi:mevalonate kinase
MEKMPVERSASGKVILCGEHSVVYGRPAIAVPISDMRAYASVEPAPAAAGLHIVAADLRQETLLHDAPPDHPLGKTARLVLDHLGVPEPDAVLTVRSDLAIGSGMGSGAAITVAAIRALSAFLGTELPPERVSALTYEVEKIHHGTPSGIDNTVIAWERPVYFVKGGPPETFSIAVPFSLLIAYSGITSSTREAVAEVRRRWLASPDYYDMVFNCVGAISRAARAAIEQGALQALGTLLNENHGLLSRIGVSLPQLDAMVNAAREAGALGAKLTGSGQGGNIIALVKAADIDAVEKALWRAGATKIWRTHVEASQA